jgi:hypothetical protein
VTLDELSRSLPNGLHDAEIFNVALDYVARTARLGLNVWIGRMDAPAGPEREKHRRGEIELTGLLSCAIDLPDFGLHYGHFADPGPVTTGGVSSVESPSPIPQGAFEAKLFIDEWNSFIHVAATGASLTWIE